MTHGVPFFDWRDGRPRWVPSPGLRKLGWKGRDLKDGHGAFLSLEIALDEAHAINVKAGVSAGKQRLKTKEVAPPKPASKLQGFVYFLRTGTHVKIGFSTDPFQRANALKTAIAQGVFSLGAVRATRHDEKRIHWALRSFRRSGEWFDAQPAVISVMVQSLIAGAVVLKLRQRA